MTIRLRGASKLPFVALILLFCFNVNAQSLLNAVQWKKADGGNDHWYAILAVDKLHTEALALAPTIKVSNLPGHLATVTSEAENVFIKEHVLTGVQHPWGNYRFHLGGWFINGSWTWITDEPFTYTNWAPYQPESSEPGTPAGMLGSPECETKINCGTWATGETTGWSVIEWGVYDNLLPDTITFKKVVQWPSSQGGNDHWYAVVPYARPWKTHDSLARTLSLDGEPGYLASLTSAAEHDYIVRTLLDGVRANTAHDWYFLGGYLSSGLLHWVTGEAFLYEFWGPEKPPSGVNGNTVILRGWSDPGAGWFGAASETDRLWAIVEFGPANTGPRWDSLYTKLCQWKPTDGGNGHWYALIPQVAFFTSHQLIATNQKFQGQVGFLATVTSKGENEFITDNLLRGTALYASNPQCFLGAHYADSYWGYRWEWFTGEPWSYTNWNTGEPSSPRMENALAIMGHDIYNPGRLGKWNDTKPDQIGAWAIVEWVPQYMCGDVDGDSVVTASDLTRLISYYFSFGTGPTVLEAADANGNQVFDLGDLTFIAAFLSGERTSPCFRPSEYEKGIEDRGLLTE